MRQSKGGAVRPMRLRPRRWNRNGPGRVVWVLLCAAALALGAGCRKSATDIAEEEREVREEHLEAKWRLQQAEAQAQNLFYRGKDLQRQGRYKEAVAAWAEAMSVDKRNTELSVQLAKNLMADEMLDVAHYRMHRPYENRAYPQSAREILQIIVNKDNGFFEKHVKKAYKELDEWEWIKGGWKKFDAANELIATHRLAEGLDLLESIAKNYPRTPLQDKAILLLVQYGRRERD